MGGGRCLSRPVAVGHVSAGLWLRGSVGADRRSLLPAAARASGGCGVAVPPRKLAAAARRAYSPRAVRPCQQRFKPRCQGEQQQERKGASADSGARVHSGRACDRGRRQRGCGRPWRPGTRAARLGRRGLHCSYCAGEGRGPLKLDCSSGPRSRQERWCTTLVQGARRAGRVPRGGGHPGGGPCCPPVCACRPGSALDERCGGCVVVVRRATAYGGACLRRARPLGSIQPPRGGRSHLGPPRPHMRRTPPPPPTALTPPSLAQALGAGCF